MRRIATNGLGIMLAVMSLGLTSADAAPLRSERVLGLGDISPASFPNRPPAKMRLAQRSIPEHMYRPGMPEVLQPEDDAPPAPSVTSQEIINRFRDTYRARNRPRIAIFWNRQLSDKISQWFGARRLIVTGEFDVTKDTAPNQGTISGRHTAKIASERLRTDVRRRSMTEVRAWEFENGYYQPLLNSGARLVDRSAILRLTHTAKNTGGVVELRPDIQVIEVKALRGKADVLMEVLLTTKSDAPLGFAFRIVVKDIKTGIILGSVFSSGTPPEYNQTKSDYVPAPGGFVAKPPEPLTPQIIGHQLAIETMDMMVGALERRSR